MCANHFADAYSENVLLEALSSEVYIQPPRWATARTTRYMGVRLQPSTESTRDRVHLRPGDLFSIDSALFELEFYEGEDVQVASSAISDSAIVDLEEKHPGAGALQLPEDELLVSTPFPSRTLSTTIQDTPSMPSRHFNPVEDADHLIQQIAGNAIQGDEDSQNWSPNLAKREILGTIRGAQRRSLPRPQELKKVRSPLLPSRSAMSAREDTDAAGSPTNDSDPAKNSSPDVHRPSTIDSSKGESIDLLPETELSPDSSANGLRGLDVNRNATVSELSTTEVNRDMSRNEPAEQKLTETLSRPNPLRQYTEQLHPLNGATAASSRAPEEPPKRMSVQLKDGDEKDGFSDQERINKEDNLLIAASPGGASLPKVIVPFVESNESGSPPLATASDEVFGQPTEDDAAPSMPHDEVETKATSPNPVNLDKIAAPTFAPMHLNGLVMGSVNAAEEDAQTSASDAEDTQETTRRRCYYLLKVAVDSQQPSSSQTDALLVPDVDDRQPYLDDGMQDTIESMTEAGLGKDMPPSRTTSMPGEGNASRLGRSKRKRSDRNMSDTFASAKGAKIRKTQNPSSSQDSIGITIVVQKSALKSARTRGPAKSLLLSEQVEASPLRTRASFSSSQSSGTDTKPRILFASSTTIDTQPRCMSFLQRHGAIKVETVQRCNLLCVGKGKELKKTSKLIQAIASGIDVVTDEWILQSVRDGRLLDSSAFLARDPEREAEWGITMTEAIARGKQGRKPFHGWTILFTPALKKELGKGFAELKEIATHAGARTVRAAIPRKTPDETAKMLLLTAESDEDLALLLDKGWRCYSKDILTLSVLRGVLDPESDEFLLSVNESS